MPIALTSEGLFGSTATPQKLSVFDPANERRILQVGRTRAVQFKPTMIESDGSKDFITVVYWFQLREATFLPSFNRAEDLCTRREGPDWFPGFRAKGEMKILLLPHGCDRTFDLIGFPPNDLMTTPGLHRTIFANPEESLSAPKAPVGTRALDASED